MGFAGSGPQCFDAIPYRLPPLAFPAPIGVFLRFPQPRYQRAAADGKRVAAALGSEAAQQFVRGAPAQIE